MNNKGKPQDFNLDQIMTGVQLKHIPLRYILNGYISSYAAKTDTHISKELLFVLLHGDMSDINDLTEDELETIKVSDPATSYLSATLNHQLVYEDTTKYINELITKHFN